jgi:hypothetical protein
MPLWSLLQKMWASLRLGGNTMRRPSFASTISCIALFFSLSGAAAAATGGYFILGRSNSANAVTSLTNTAGTALSLTAKAGTPALKVNTTEMVPNLNANRLGNLTATELMTATAVGRGVPPPTGVAAATVGRREPWGGVDSNGRGRMTVAVTKRSATSCLAAEFHASNFVMNATGRMAYNVYLADAAGNLITGRQFGSSHYFNTLNDHRGWSANGVLGDPPAGDYYVTLAVTPMTSGMRVITDQNDSATMRVDEIPGGC